MNGLDCFTDENIKTRLGFLESAQMLLSRID